MATSRSPVSQNRELQLAGAELIERELHPLQHALRCPYHPDGDSLCNRHSEKNDSDEFVLRCPECEREFRVEAGVYRLMPDEFRIDQNPHRVDSESIQQMTREMRQRDERAVRSSLFRREPDGSPLYWMNIQYDAVARLASVGGGAIGVDFGTGVGRYVPWLLERFERVIAIDFSFESLRALQENLSAEQRVRCLFVQCDLSRLGLARGVASGGLCIEVLQHVPDAGMRKSAIANIARALIDDGTLCLVTNAYAIARRLGGSPQVRQDGTIYSYWHTYGELRRLVEPYFEIETSRGIISYDTFPVRKLPARWRLRADAMLERSSLGRLFGRDMLLNLRRNAN